MIDQLNHQHPKKKKTHTHNYTSIFLKTLISLT